MDAVIVSVPPPGMMRITNIWWDINLHTDIDTGTGSIVVPSTPPTGKENIINMFWDAGNQEIAVETSTSTSQQIFSHPTAGNGQIANIYYNPNTGIIMAEGSTGILYTSAKKCINQRRYWTGWGGTVW